MATIQFACNESCGPGQFTRTVPSACGNCRILRVARYQRAADVRTWELWRLEDNEVRAASITVRSYAYALALAVTSCH